MSFFGHDREENQSLLRAIQAQLDAAAERGVKSSVTFHNAPAGSRKGYDTLEIIAEPADKERR